MLQDLRFGLRMLVKSPGFTAIAVLSVALGIGANTAIFSLINAALLRPIPVRDSDRLASVFMTDQRNPGNLPLSHLNYKDIRDQNQVFSEVAGFSQAQMNWTNGTAAEQVPMQVVSGNYFTVLGTQLAQGRAFLPEEDVKATPVVVISDGFWQRSLGGDPAIVGKTLTFNRNAFTVIGVAPRGFTGTLLGVEPGGLGSDGDSRRRAAELRLVRAAAGFVSLCLRPAEAGRVDGAGWRPAAHALCQSRADVSERQQGAKRRRRAAAASALESAGTGRQPAGAPLADPDGGRRHRPLDRVRECREPVDRARDAPA